MVIKKLFRKIDEYSEECCYLECTRDIDDDCYKILMKLLNGFSYKSNFRDYDVIEWGKSQFFESPFSSNVVDILNRLGINNITRVELTTRIIKTNFNKELLDPIMDQIYESPIVSFDDTVKLNKLKNIEVDIDSLAEFGEEHGMAFDDDDIEYYTTLFKDKLNRNPTSCELYDLSQGNSEHSRHWFFNGKFTINGIEMEKSPFQHIKEPLKLIKSDNVSKVAFKDNASAIMGIESVDYMVVDNPSEPCNYRVENITFHPTLTAETHNFPTGIAPFQGAETGVGGRIRDTQSIGRGGMPVAGLAGYCVGEISDTPRPELLHTAENILLKASNGASDYGNKFGEPIIGGFCRNFKGKINHNRKVEEREWIKPIMFSAGIGKVRDESTIKPEPQLGMKICKLGGPAYRIGIGGGSASSRAQDKKNKNLDISAVQRGNAEMENRLNRVVRACSELENNIIYSIHDQGAGGTSNVTKEIVEPYGSIIDIDKIIVGDKTMTPLEIWVSEYQEQNTILVEERNLKILEDICIRENLPLAVIGDIIKRDNITVKSASETILDLPVKEILTNIPRKHYKLDSVRITDWENTINLSSSLFNDYLMEVLKLPSVACKHFLTSKVDRSVTGLIAQQQCVGPLHLPVADNSIIANSYFNMSGVVSSIGEQPLKGLYNHKNGVRMAIGEMLTNMISTVIPDIKDIRCSGNWMWANCDNDNKFMLYDATHEVSKLLSILGFAIDGGKDSLSMVTKYKDKTVKGPNQFVITGYCNVKDVTKTAQPYFKKAGNTILHIDLGFGKRRIGGSAFCQVINDFKYKTPDFENPWRFANIFKLIQLLIQNNNIISCHDISDGGLITSVLEMAFAGDLGVDINIVNNDNIFNYMFSEELGLVVETSDPKPIMELLNKIVPVTKIGTINDRKIINLIYNSELINSLSLEFYRTTWMSFGHSMLKKHTNELCVNSEIFKKYSIPKHSITFKHIEHKKSRIHRPLKQHIVGILREEGSNGDKEMAWAFYNSGFVVKDINMRDIVKCSGKILDGLDGLVFVGGFSYADVLGAGVGWASSIKYNESISSQFSNFYNKENTFSLGICNGCQLMGLLDWVPGKCTKNISNRFESRYVSIKITKSNSIMLKDMEDSVLGVWVAHGEGNIVDIKEDTMEMYPVRYVDNNNYSTTKYPDNPNGSKFGIAGMCSKNGRHLAMMPHPERGVITWQNPWVPEEWKGNRFYPWKKMFDNAYDWCCSINSK